MIKCEHPVQQSILPNDYSPYLPRSAHLVLASKGASILHQGSNTSTTSASSTASGITTMYQPSLPAIRTSFSGPSGNPGGNASGAPPSQHSASYSSYHSGATAQGGPPPLPSPVGPSNCTAHTSGGPPGHSPMASDMAAWGNSQGAARPHTADAVFGNGYGGFGPSPVNGPPHLPLPKGAAPSAYGPGSGRMFAYMPSSDDSPGAEAAYGHGPAASPYGGSYTTGSSTPYASTAPGTATSTAPSSAGTGASKVEGHKKRPRRRYDEIERLYPCNWPGCTKSYGTLNHLNAHVAMQKHGTKRLPNEFKDMRRAWRKAKRDEDQRRQSNAQQHMKEQEEAMFRGRIGSLPGPGTYYPPPHHMGGPGMYPPPARAYGSYPPPQQGETSPAYPPTPGTGSSSGAGASGHMLPPMPGRSYSMGNTAGYSAYPTGLAAPAGPGGPGAGAGHDHYAASHGGAYGGGPHYHHQQSSAPASSAGPTGASNLGAYLMAHRGSI